VTHQSSFLNDFGNFIKFNNWLLPKHHFTFVPCFVIIQIYKKNFDVDSQLFQGYEPWTKRSQVFRLRRNYSFSSTVSPFWNSITFEIFGDGLCMSPISNSKLSRPLWTTLHPMFANDEFILVKTNSICIAQAWCCLPLLSPCKQDLCNVKVFFFFYTKRTWWELHLLFWE
jgi:hypothetical protein